MRHYRKNLFFIALAALVLRLIFVYESAAANGGANAMLTPSPLSDLYTYWELSGRILSGTFHGEFYYQPFYYAVFLPLLRLVSGNSILFVAIVQSVLGAATVYLTGLSAVYVFNRRAGYIASALCAVSSPLILYTPFLQNETLQIFNFALIFYLTLSSAYSGKVCWRTGLLGLWCAIAILTRGNAWLLLPGVVCYVGYAGKSWRKAAAVAALAVALQLPFVWHNSCVKGTFTGPSTAAAAVLALGNTPEAPPGGREFDLPAGAMEYPEAYRIFMDRLPERSAALQIWDFIRREPLAFAELEFRKLLLVFDSREIPNNVSMASEGEASLFLPRNLPGDAGIILAFGLAGMLLFVFRGGKRLYLLYYFTAALIAGVVMFYVLARFRAVLLVFMAIFAGGALDELLLASSGRSKKRRRLLNALLATTLGVFTSYFAFDLYRYGLERRVMRLVRPEGVNMENDRGELISLDHGPLSFGSWVPVPAERGTSVAKRWARAVPGEGKILLKILTEEPGSLVLKSNGEMLRFELPEAGLHDVTLSCPKPDGFAFEVFAVLGKHFFLSDLQRDYGRTQVNGAGYGELVARRFVKIR